MKWFEKDHFGGLRGLSDAAARLFDWTTPNLVTLAGLVLVVPMTLALFTGHVVIGLVLFTLSALTDFLDGAMARYQEDRLSEIEKRLRGRKHVLLQRGQTSEGFLSGASLDPFVDKLRFFCAVVPLGWPGLSLWLLISAVVFAGLLTGGRVYVEALKKRDVLRPDYKPKANRFGKFKAHAEIILIALLAASKLGVPKLMLPANIVLAFAVALGALSFGGQAYSLYHALKKSPR